MTGGREAATGRDACWDSGLGHGSKVGGATHLKGMTQQPRQPQGTPAGGQYASLTHSEALLTLEGEIGEVAETAETAKSRAAGLHVQAAVHQTLARFPDARYIVAGYSDQDYYGTLVPHAPLDADGEEIDDTHDLAWCNEVEEHLGQLDDSDRSTYERWASDEYLEMRPRDRSEQPVVIDVAKVLADPVAPTSQHRVTADGDERWELPDGALHRINGPSLVRPDGYEECNRYGVHHRDDGPAVTWPDGLKEWYRDGRLHREDGPAVVRVADGLDPEYGWYLDGRGQPVKPTAQEVALFIESDPPRDHLVDVASQYAEILEQAGRSYDAAALRGVEGLDHAEIAQRVLVGAGTAAATVGRRLPIRLWR